MTTLTKVAVLLVLIQVLISPIHAQTEDQVNAFKSLAENGDVRAQFALGFCYYSGTGVAKDDIEAIKWYRMAAEQGNEESQYAIGYCYENGTGVAKDNVEAVKWYRKAADQGQADAQARLAYSLITGEGGKQNLIEAYALLNLAGIENENAREARSKLEKVLTSPQQDEGQRRTKELQAEIKAKKSKLPASE